MDASGFGHSWGGTMSWLVALAIVGGVVGLAFLGAIVGGILALPYALWHHDLRLTFLPMTVGAVIPNAAAGLYLLAEWAFSKWGDRL
ncbi:hypothetical protein GURKE_04220 [Brevundimonas phage vB_BpoS-Gurke]|uniref:Uncharacterized protein n=1 Tax=Brevundimonas phage vB_BpoS-Gurke TaxID=2948599 RepID=A0A9E7N4Y3_9CAUD|nr:hypothetical protein GURKE_04220 [Brevundimonas phage vB_BpoS-Gurke]